MSQDYYDPSPGRPLPRPLALTGFLGARVGSVAGALSATTGHPLFDLVRAVEHHAGCTVDELVLREGVGELRRLERALLPPALERAPPPVIALGEGTLLDPELRGLVCRAAHLVYLRMDLPTTVASVTAQVQRNPGRHYAWLLGLVPSERLLGPLLEERRPGYEAAHLVIEASMEPSRTAREVSRHLPR